MERLTSIIIDDELHGRENLKHQLENFCTDVKVLATAESAVTGNELVQMHKPDVVFLDVNMPLLDGFDFLDYFDKREFLTVIVSAYMDHGVRAVKAKADDYLLKPVNTKELRQTIKNLITIKKSKSENAISKVSEKVALPSSNGFEVYEVEKIIRLEASGCYTKVFFEEMKSVFISRTLKEIEANLPRNLFFRIHKSHLINLKYFKSYSKLDGGKVRLFDGTEVEISRRKISDFLKITRQLITML